jgi:hypothetical protein
VEPKDVPASPEVVSSTATCSARRPGEVLLSVSPEGHAWLVVPGAPNSVRVLDPFEAAMTETIEDVDVPALLDAQAWSASDAALVAEDGIWRLEEFARVSMTPPTGFELPASLCGDPGTNGVLVSAGMVFERRADQNWWGWDPGVAGDGAPAGVVRFDGECQSADDITWLTARDGTLYRVEPAQFSRPVRFASFAGAAATEGMLAILETDRLWVGPDAWQSWIFPGPVPAEVSASGGRLWMMSGTQLLSFDGATWIEVTHGVSGAVERVAAHAGGAWLVGADAICHQAMGPMLRVEGLRPFSRSAELDHSIRVRASDATMSVAADVDGAAIDLALDPETGWLEGDVRLGEVGWHTIGLSSADASAHRSILVKRLPETVRSWATDVEPIYQASCAGGLCHGGSSDAPNLATVDAWRDKSAAIRTRVVEARTMPPPASAGPDWGDDDVEIIREWLEGGMLP